MNSSEHTVTQEEKPSHIKRTVQFQLGGTFVNKHIPEEPIWSLLKYVTEYSFSMEIKLSL